MRARLKVSRAGVELIKSFEGLRTTAARLPDGRWTLGYGHTFSAREGATATQEDADALLRFDLLPIVDAINNVVLVPMNQNQFDALVSFCFNIGVDNFAQSSVCKRINEGRMTEAAQAMDSWRSAEFNGQTYVLAPLIRRRAAEKNLFLTPEDTVGNAPSLLIRPVEDAGQAYATPSEVDAPSHGGILSARPSGLPEQAVEAVPQSIAPSYTPSFEISATPQPVLAASVAPVTPERQVIDLSTFAPRSVDVAAEPAAPAPVKPTIQVMADVAPSESVVEQLPHGLMSSGSVRETPAAAPVEQAPTAYDYSVPPVMSPDVQAALARAQEEQRLRDEALRQAEALAAARAAEEARQREEMRLREEARLQVLQQQEFARMEQLRLEQEQRERLAREEQMRAELARLEQARQEQALLEQARLDEARLEQARLEQARLEQAALEQARAEQARLDMQRAEQVRLEQEQAERDRQESLRLEAARAETARLEEARIEAARLEEARMEAARLEAARLEAARAEQARLDAERERQEAAQREQTRLEQERQAQLQTQTLAQAQPAADAPSAEDVEKARKAEAAAALMRLYSPYGSGGLGRPLTPNVLPKADAGPALEPNPAPRAVTPAPEPAPAPQPVPVQPVRAPEPQAVALEPDVEDEDAEVQVVSDTVSFAFKPVGSASQMPPPQVTALNPYARPIPQATETFIEVPRPAAVDLSAPSLAPQMQAEAQQPKAENLHWREQLQRPLPPGYQSSEPARPAAAPVQAAAQATRLDDAFDTDDWTNSGDRIALSAEEMEEETVSFWRMLSSTLGWIVSSSVGLACLGVAAGAFWLAKNNMSVAREGRAEMLTMVSIGAASLGILLVVTSVWLIMKRLAGLKE